MTEEVIFYEALERRDPRERATYLDAACAGDVELRRNVEALLHAHFGTGELLEGLPTLGEFAATSPFSAAKTGPMAEGPGTVIGAYTLVQKLGEGGMGVVFLAEQDLPVKRQVALKVVKPGMDSSQVIARFEAERQALALMDHPNIARVLDAGTTDSGRPFFVMERVTGIQITEWCDVHRLSPRERLDLFISVCHAIQHAHQKGIIHRDIKPSNVLVTLYDDKAVPKVIDFGVAKAINQGLTERTLFTQLGMVVGTPEYMSPEQAELSSQDIDTRSDVYSLGVLLYELLTGATPLDRGRLRAAALVELLRVIREEEPPRPSTRLSTAENLATIAERRKMEPAKLARLVRGELDWIVMKAIEKDRSRRYETADALARDVERYLALEPLDAGPPSAVYRLRKLARRHRALLSTVMAFAAVLVVSAAVSIWQADRAIKAKREAVGNLTKAKDEAAKAKSMLTFFQERVLAAPRPPGQEGGLGRSVTLLSALQAAEPALKTDFSGQPSTEAQIRDTLGTSYQYLDDIPGAIRQYERACELFDKSLGPESPEALGSASNLALAYLYSGRAADSVKLSRKTVELAKRKLGDGNIVTLTCLNNLANGYLGIERPVDAVPVFQEVLRALEVSQGKNNPMTVACRNNLAEAYRASGRPKEATPLLEEVLAALKSSVGLSHPDSLACMNNLANAYHDSGRIADAIKVQKDALAQREEALGPDHSDTLLGLSNLAVTYRSAGLLNEAIPLHEKVLERVLRKLGPNHPDVLSAKALLGVAYRSVGRENDAIRLLEEALKRPQSNPTPDQPSAIFDLGELVAAYLATKRWDDAEGTARRRLKSIELRPPDTWSRFHAMSQLGAALEGQGKFTEAEPLLGQGYEGLVHEQPRISQANQRYVSEAASRLVPFYHSWGKPDKAKEWQVKLERPSSTSAPKH
jgi:serine/threonine protein kinase